ncbi:MAG TPA: 2TM domain-containing protein [Acidimicrobiales bacterium]|nr:2TM domain-containing protein [Acidimicrobiales bacterium]
MTDDFEAAALAELEAKAASRGKSLAFHAATWVALNAFLVLIWLLTGAGYPWFLFPAGATAIPLALHATAVRLSGPDENQRMVERARRRAIGTGDDWGL